VLRQGNGVADLHTEATDRENVVAALVGTTDRQQLTPIIWALESYYRAREQAQQLGQQRTQLEQNLATQIAALDMANLALQDAHRRLLTEREQERKALARELHDQVIQDLLSVNYELEEIAGEAPTQVDSLAGELGDVRDSIRALVDDLRRICGTLRPPTIDSLGVGAALQSYTRDWSARTGIPVTVALDKQLGRLPEPLELSIFRIIQEGLNNVRKHAQATAVQIGLGRTTPGSLTITIADNGCGLPPGFDLATLAAGGHFGVLGISERVALVEGRMRLENQATGGTLLEVEIPDPQGRAEGEP
jgi:signal transduction histidine kinase